MRLTLPILRLGHPTTDGRILEAVTVGAQVPLLDGDMIVDLLDRFCFGADGWLTSHTSCGIDAGVALEAVLDCTEIEVDDDGLIHIDGTLRAVRLGDNPAWPDARVRAS